MTLAGTETFSPSRTEASKGKTTLYRTLSKAALGLSILATALGIGCSGKVMNTTTPPTVNKALWVANGANVVEFLPTQLAQGAASMAPHLANNSGVFGAPQGVTFDAAGNLWVIDGGNLATPGGTAKPALYQFTAAQLAALGTTNNPTPNITINSASFTFPQQAVFDANGNLYVSDNQSNAVFVLKPAQLMTTNMNLTPDITITSTPAFNGPLGITFDSAGDLWVANNGTTTIFEFNAGALPTMNSTVALTPNVMLSDNGHGSIQGPWALVFDSTGNLWSSNANAPNTVVQFPKASLAATGMPTPAVTLSPAMVGTNSTLSSPNGIAFDNLGDLAAVSSATPFGLGLFAKTQLTAGGAVAPNTFLVGTVTTLNAPAGCNFGPIVN